MSREYPDWISPDRAAEGRRVFRGTIPLARLQRLVPLLVDAQGEVTFKAAFSRDMDKRVRINLQAEASLRLVCQASLEVYDEQVKRRSELVVIEADSELDELSDHCEAVKTEHGRIAIAELVEDELLLGLPHFPRKPGLHKIEYSTNTDSLSKAGHESVPRENDNKSPFADLKDMLENRKQD